MDFSEIFVSEIHHSRSATIEQVVDAVKLTGGVALKGAIQAGYSSHTGELQSLNMKLRRQLDLFANVVHIKVTFKHSIMRTQHTCIDILFYFFF